VKRKPNRLAIAAILAVCISAVAWIGFLHLRPRQITEKDAIVLAEFTNATGNPVFDDTLRQGLAVQLEQSPFLKVVSDEEVQQTILLMRRPSNTKLTADVAREVCQRTGSTILIEGAIAQIGGRYSLILRAVNCNNGESIASTETQAADKNHVLEALGKASSDMRKKLGESLATIQKFDVPLIQATTSSLEALQVYSLGYKEKVAKGNSVAAIPLLQQATKLDPNFAMAYSTLGLSYWNVGENTLATESIRKAFELRAGLTEWEKLRIESEYPSLVTNNLVKARSACEVWAQTYPRDWAPRNQLGVIHTVLGQHDQALAEYRAAMRLSPDSGLILGNIINSYLALDRLDAARAILLKENARNPDSPGLRIYLYHLAFLQKDFKEMDRQAELGAGKPGLESELLWNQSATAAFFGELEKARALGRQAVASLSRAGGREAAAGYEAKEALREALFGNPDAAKARAEAAVLLTTGPDARYQAALAFASAGDPGRARALASDLNERFPEDTIVQFIYLPTIKAQLSLNGQDTGKAIEFLQTAFPYELGGGLLPAYFRGLAHLAARQPNEAQVEFQKILNHRGVVFNSPIGALAHLQIGGAFHMQGDTAKARDAYREFLVLWKDADPEVPILMQAKAELAKLNP
jgi:Flp pilus assembly protein TadD